MLHKSVRISSLLFDNKKENLCLITRKSILVQVIGDDKGVCGFHKIMIGFQATNLVEVKKQ